MKEQARDENCLEEHAQDDNRFLTLDQLKAAIGENVRIDAHDPYPKSRIRVLFADYVAFLRKHHWEGLIKNNPRFAIIHICALLKPKSLRDYANSSIVLNRNGVGEK